MVAGVFEQKGVMAVRRIDFGVGHRAAVLQQASDQLARTLGRETPIGGEGHQQEVGRGRRQGARQVSPGIARRIEIIERTGDQQIGVGVEIARELLALVAQIGLHLEFDVIAIAVGAVFGGLALRAAEFLGHVVIGQIGDVPDHARDRQAPARHGVVGVVVAAVEIRIGDDGAARHLVEADILRRQARRAGDDHAMRHPLGQGQGPAQGLHAAQRAAHDGAKRWMPK